MGKVDLDELVTHHRLAALRNLAGLPCSTEQGVRVQMERVDSKLETPESAGFEVKQVDEKNKRVRILDPKLIAYAEKVSKIKY